MARTARFKIEDQETYYHICSRTAGPVNQFPLKKDTAKHELVKILAFYAKVYFCELATYNVLGNHYHAVIKFKEKYGVSDKELHNRAYMLYPDKQGRDMISAWTDDDWKKFKNRLFDISEFMRNVQSRFARWYNSTYKRRGRFWADRFKSTVLSDMQAVKDCMMYVDLNPVRATLATKPEDWKYGALYMREIGKDQDLMSLDAITESDDSLTEYKANVYYRGAIPTKEGQAVIDEATLEREQARGFKTRGVYRKRIRYFTDGLAIGTEVFIRQQIQKLRQKREYSRRRNPVPQMEGMVFSLREQRGVT